MGIEAVYTPALHFRGYDNFVQVATVPVQRSPLTGIGVPFAHAPRLFIRTVGASGIAQLRSTFGPQLLCGVVEDMMYDTT